MEAQSVIKIFLPKLDSLKRTICRERKRTQIVPSEPTSLQTLQIPVILKTNKGQPFLLYDSGSIAGNSRIIKFGTEQNVETLSTSIVCLADETFKVAPQLFYQFYVVHGLKGGPQIHSKMEMCYHVYLCYSL